MKLTDDYYARWTGKDWIVETFYLTKRVVIAGKQKGGKTAVKVVGHYKTIADAVKTVAEIEGSKAEELKDFLVQYEALLLRIEKFKWFESIFREQDIGKDTRFKAVAKRRHPDRLAVDGGGSHLLHRAFARWIPARRRK